MVHSFLFCCGLILEIGELELNSVVGNIWLRGAFLHESCL